MTNSPYLKAIAPAVLTLIAVLGQWLATGEFGRAELATAITGLLAATVVYFVPNAEPSPAPVTTEPADVEEARTPPDTRL